MTHPLDKLREALRELTIDDLVRNCDCVDEELDRRRDALLNAKDAAIAAANTFDMRLAQAKEDKRNRDL